MTSPTYPVSAVADEAPLKTKATNYPEPFASQMAGRRKQPLGDLFGLTNFGVNLTRLAPKAVSALRHAHTKQDEFVYILQGHPTLHTDEGRARLSPGMCAGFKAGTGNGHREGGWEVYEFYSETKVGYVDFSGRLQRAQIDTYDASPY